MARSSAQKSRTRGEITKLPSGSLRVKVYSGIDPLTKKRHYLTETIPAGPQARKLSEQARVRLLNQVDELRNPRTRATVNQLMDRYLELLDVEQTTRQGYEGYINNHIRLVLGKLPLAKLDGEIFDSFYKRLRTCRYHCGGRQGIEHRTKAKHECDERCGQHCCEPLSDSTIRQIHWILSGALKRAVRWRWITSNPISQAEPPSPPPANPQPPSAEQAARISNAAWEDPDWGMLVWLTMRTGARRGEVCALRWSRLDLDSRVLVIRSSIAQRGGKTWEKDTKTHQQRRIALDVHDIELLRAYRDHWRKRAEALGIFLADDAFIFSLSPDGSTYLKPDSVSQRYAKMCSRLGWDMNIHQLRHYSATELISAGVDVRTVAGRLGHGGGGTTTLRVYAAWVSESDQRAASALAQRMPLQRQPFDSEQSQPDTPPSLYQKIAEELRSRIERSALRPGDHLPTLAELSHEFKVAEGTAHRAISVLKSEGLVVARRGVRAVVAPAVQT